MTKQKALEMIGKLSKCSVISYEVSNRIRKRKAAFDEEYKAARAVLEALTDDPVSVKELESALWDL